MARRLRTFLLSCALVITPSVAVMAPAQATTTAPVVVTIPQEVRAQPRQFIIWGRTDDGHLAVTSEADPTTGPTGAETEVLVAPDGSETTLTKLPVATVGNRIVATFGSSPTSIASKLVGDSSWSQLAIPSGDTYASLAPEGVLVGAGSYGSQQLALLPWDGSAAVTIPLPGLPTDLTIEFTYKPVRQGSLQLIRVGSVSQGEFGVLVDTSTDQAWVVNPTNPNCLLSFADSMSINEGVIAWQSEVLNGSGQRQICTMPVPAPSDTTVAEPTTRPSPTLPAAAGYANKYQVMAVGSDVVVWSPNQPGVDWGLNPMPLVAVDPQGNVRTIRSWASNVEPTTSGHVLAVTGTAPGVEQVEDIDVATGTGTQMFAVPSVPAWYQGIAVDGSRVVYADNSGYLGGVRQRTVDFTAGTMSSSTLLDDDASGPVAADLGATGWGRTGLNNIYGRHLASDGTLIGGAGYPVLTDDRFEEDVDGNLLDTATGLWTMATPYYPPYLQDGVVYSPGKAITGQPANAVVALDPVAHRAEVRTISQCTTVDSVQVAGSWMLVDCNTSPSVRSFFVVDLTGVTATYQLSPTGEVQLGNGFVVERALSTGDFSWAPLGVAQPTWQSLGSVGATPSGAVGQHDWALAVSSSSVPTVAWFDGTTGHVALLPVTTSPLPPKPTAITPPAAPTVKGVGLANTLGVSWNAPATADGVTSFIVTAHTTASVPDQNVSATVSASATSETFYLYGDTGATYDVSVTAVNVAGGTTSTVPVTLKAPPSAPTNLGVTVDPVTGEATLTWGYTTDLSADTLTGFSVWQTGVSTPLVQGLPTTARSYSFTLDHAWTGTLQVHSDAALQSSVAVTGTVSIPGPDTTSPTAWVGKHSPVLLSRSVTLQINGIDDRELATNPMDVRWATAMPGEALGAWVQPAVWQGIATGKLPVTGLSAGETACFSVRATDWAGNVSAWSPSRCVTVALDDRAMHRSSSTALVTGRVYYRHTSTVMKRPKSWLRFPGLFNDTGWLIATTGPTFGKVRVIVGGVSYGTINLHASRVHHRVRIKLPFSAVSGGLTIRPVGLGNQPIIDGLALLTH